MSVDQDPITEEPKKQGHDNLAFEPSRSRKISAISNHSEHGPVRKKSILLHADSNSGFDSPRSRKVSSGSDHAESGPVRKKSTLLRADSNSGFDSPRSRKVSSASDHAETGPVRKKSILHNAQNSNNENHDGKHFNGDIRHKKTSVTESVYSKTRFSDVEDDNRSWWYTFFVKCRQEDPHPSWYPPLWPKVCPYPFCPTYRQFSRVVALILIGSLSWCVLYSVIGKTAAPGGTLFTFMVLSLASYFGGVVFSVTTLPPLIGMLFTGFILQNVGIINIDDSYTHISKECRNIALVIILIRAGLDMDPNAFLRLKFTVVKIGVFPWLVEAVIVMITAHFLIPLPWSYAAVLGSIIAAVSPAVVVPCLCRLRSKGYGVAKGIPTLIVAISGIDDALSVAIFGIIKSIMFSNEGIVLQILQGPISIVGGIGFGVLWGVICKYAPEKHDPFLVPLRILLLGVGGMISVFGSELIGYAGAGPLACVTSAFMALVFWLKQGWEIEENPAATAFEIFWMIFEPILFGITGAQIKVRELEGEVVAVGIGILVLGCVVRIAVTVVLGIGSKFNLKEKVFVALALMPKATVQAALGPIVLNTVQSDDEELVNYANKILAICVLSIMLTAPIGAILITLTGTKLLTKTKFPEVPETWRRSHRPSIRDISIIDEEEEKDAIDVENGDNIVVNKENHKPGENE